MCACISVVNVKQDVEALFLGNGATATTWAAESNLDAFFTRMYRYYKGHGFPSILASHITNLM